MKVLVTGSEGSLMQAVIPKLVAKGHEVFGVDNLHKKIKSYEDLHIIKQYKNRAKEKGYQFHHDDICDPSSMRNIFTNLNGIDIVFQGAARIYGVGGFHKYPADILSYDVHAHSNVLQIAKEYGTKVVFI